MITENTKYKAIFTDLDVNHNAHIRTRFWRRKIPTYCVKMLVNPNAYMRRQAEKHR